MANENEKLSRHQIMLVPGDYAKIQSVYGNNAASIVRALIRKFVRDQIEPQLGNTE